MISFILGVSITMNLVLFILIFFILKYRKVVSLYDKVKRAEEIDDYEEMRSFFDINKL